MNVTTPSARIVTAGSGESKYTNSLAPEDVIITSASALSAHRNREFIAEILKKYLSSTNVFEVFEVGSGTADQVPYFCEQLSNLKWIPSDRVVCHPLIIETLRKANMLQNPVTFDIDEDDIPGNPDVVYASNVVHCVPWETTEALFKKASVALDHSTSLEIDGKIGGLFILYGPYNDNGFTSIGNENFDAKLKKQDNRLGLRETRLIEELAASNDLICIGKHLHVSVNNLVLVFQKV